MPSADSTCLSHLPVLLYSNLSSGPQAADGMNLPWQENEDIVCVNHDTAVIKVVSHPLPWKGSISLLTPFPEFQLLSSLVADCRCCFFPGFLASKRVRRHRTLRMCVVIPARLTFLAFCSDYFATLVSGGTNVLIHRVSR